MVEVIQQFTKEDFINGTAPYEAVYKLKDDSFEEERMLNAISVIAKKVADICNFKSLYKEYKKKVRKAVSQTYVANATNFQGQSIELDSGCWTADDSGIYGIINGQDVQACVHPIMPIMRLVNVDTGIEKIKLAYRKGGEWRSVVVDKKVIASNNSIIQLSEIGVAVTSENAKYLVRYLHDIENLNYDAIPEKKSVGRLGWIGEDWFSPYVEGLEFDGHINYRSLFESVQEHGTYEAWKMAARESRSNVYARITLAAGFASVLVEPLGLHPFILHLWGGSESGKTVAQFVASAIWGNPRLGNYTQTFNATGVGLEMLASFVNSMPLVLDELQIVSDKKKFDEDIYKLCEGVGRSRSNKNLGINKPKTWANSIISSGEQPITSLVSGGGAVNRVIEMECTGKFYKEPKKVADTVKANYGFAGRKFVEWLKNKDNLAKAKQIYEKYYKILSDNSATEKQSMSGAAILAADFISSMVIFDEEDFLKPEDVSPYLQTAAAISAHDRNYQTLYETVVQNWHRFGMDIGRPDVVWGRFVEKKKTVYIINSQYNSICADKGFEPKSLLSWMGRNGKVERDKNGKNTVAFRVNGLLTRCVALKVDSLPEGVEEIDDDIQGVF